jgi:hypothetical protein
MISRRARGSIGGPAAIDASWTDLPPAHANKVLRLHEKRTKSTPAENLLSAIDKRHASDRCGIVDCVRTAFRPRRRMLAATGGAIQAGTQASQCLVTCAEPVRYNRGRQKFTLTNNCARNRAASRPAHLLRCQPSMAGAKKRTKTCRSGASCLQ